MTQGWRYSTLS